MSKNDAVSSKASSFLESSSIRRMAASVAFSACACAPIIAADIAGEASGVFFATCAVSAVSMLALLFAALHLVGSPAKSVLGSLARCGIAVLGAAASVVLFGVVALLLDLSIFAFIGTELALRVLEAMAFMGALVLSPIPVMMLAGARCRDATPLHPVKEVKSVRGAYIPIVAMTVAASLVGWMLDFLASLVPSGAVSVALFAAASVVVGSSWVFVVAAVCSRTEAEGGGSEWWKAKAKGLWERRVRRVSNAGVSCVLAFALAFSLLGDSLPAFADEAGAQTGPEPATPEVYEPPKESADDQEEVQDASDAESGTHDDDLQDAAAQTQDEAQAGTPAPSPSPANAPDIPALPPVDYYEQPELEGEPVAIEGESTLLQTSERTFTTVVGGASVAYEDASGEVRAIDNTMEEAGGGVFSAPDVYRNKENAFSAELPISDADGAMGLSITVDGRRIGIVPQDVDFSRSSARDEAVRYTEAREGIDWQYTLVGSIVKEDIVINQPVEEQPFDSLLQLPEGISARIDNGVCRIYDESSGEAVMDITAPLMTDAADAVCDEVSLSLERTDAGLLLRLLPSWEWLSAPERAYPVRIDPTENIAPQAVRVGCVEQKARNYHIGENGYSYAGYDDGNKTGTGVFKPGGHGICRTYAEINYDFGYIMSEARIDSATFSLSQYRAWSGGASNFGLYRVTDPWAFDGLTYAKQESLGHELVCFRQARTSRGYIDWDVRECVNNWVQGVWVQRGFCVKAEYERGMQCEMFEHRGSANPPRLTINWSIPDPVDEGVSLNSTTVNLRPLTEHDADNKLQFDGVFADGLATPRATVLYTLDPKGETGVSYASRSYKYPDSTSWQSSMPNATRYKDKLSNWQSHVFANLAYDTLFKVRALASKDGAAGREVTSDTFLVYKASSKDTLPYIAGHYGVTLDQLARDNRVQDCLVVGNNTIFVRNPKTNAPYNPQNLTEAQKRRIDSGLMGRGKHCEYGFEPVNMNTGNFVLEGIDATAPDIEGDFELRRTYNSKAAGESGAMGRGWSMGYTDRLSAEPSGAIVLTASDGASYWFDPDGEGGYELDGNAGYELERIAYRPEGAEEGTPDLYRYEVTCVKFSDTGA